MIDLCATQIFGASSSSIDGYVASGGTEANIEAFWILRNFFRKEHQAESHQIGLVFSEDSHYSMPKAANILGLSSIRLEVDYESRRINLDSMKRDLEIAMNSGIEHYIIVMNMATTMFGSVDPIEDVVELLNSLGVDFRIHIDAAYGGFIYPFSANDPSFSFQNEHIVSFTFDAHKLLLAPYGTGIFLIRKGLMKYAETQEARYVQGKDYTLVGSRSGANAIAVWMILHTYGSEGWKAKIEQLIKRTDWFCDELESRNIQFFRNSALNIITIREGRIISNEVMKKYHLVPDNHENPCWWKVVIMDHVGQEKLEQFLNEL